MVTLVAYAGDGNIQLAVCDNRLGQVKPHVLQGLPLGLVDCHGKGWAHWKLPVSHPERVGDLVADQLDPWDQHV